jgi:hypothetical protein
MLITAHPTLRAASTSPPDLDLLTKSSTDFRLQFANGQLVGGLDIMKELKESGELADSLK